MKIVETIERECCTSAELEGTAALLRDAEAEILRLRAAINRLTLAAGGTLVTDGDTTCTLGWWAARVLEGGGKGVTG